MGYVGVASGEGAGDDPEPFVTDRVVEVRIVMSDDEWETLQLDALEEEYVQADFWFDGELVEDIAVRPKGNSSLNSVVRQGSTRLSLKVDFNFFNSARTFRGLKKLNFNNGFNDPTFIREHISYELFDLMGLPTPRTSFVDLWINDMHMGLYTQVEQVDKTFLSRYFSDVGGNLYKPEPPAGYLNWTEANLEELRDELGIAAPEDEEIALQINMGGAKLVDIMDALEEQEEGSDEITDNRRANASEREPMDFIEKMGLKTNEEFPDHTALLNFLEVLNNEPDETFPEEIEKVLDVDSALRFIAVAGTIGYFDSYLGPGHNFYLYEVDGKFTIIPWDLNGSFGAFSMGMSRDDIINCYIDEPTIGPVAERPLVARLLAYEPYLEKYYEYLEEFLNGPFGIERMTSQINETADLIRPYVYADELKFFSNEEFERGLSQDVERSGQGGAPPMGMPPEGPPPGDFSPEGRLPPPPEGFVPPGGFPPPPGGQKALSQLSEESLDCLKSKFKKEILDELRIRRPSLEELEKLKSCLSREEMNIFLRRGPSAAAPTMGSTFIGLRTFVVERTKSIREQLEGKRPSSGDGSGSGNMRMPGLGGDFPGGPPPPL